MSQEATLSGAMDGATTPPGLDPTRLSAILRRFPRVAAAYLFGSVSRSDARLDSDVDLALVLSEPAAEPVRIIDGEQNDRLPDLFYRLHPHATIRNHACVAHHRQNDIRMLDRAPRSVQPIPPSAHLGGHFDRKNIFSIGKIQETLLPGRRPDRDEERLIDPLR